MDIGWHAARRRRHAFGVSLLAVALANSPAWAGCAPNPTTDYGTTVCTDLDADGLTVRTNVTTVQVASGAEVRGGAQAASIVGSVADASYGYGRIILQVDGTLTDGVRVDSGVPAGGSFGMTTELDVAVSAGGVIAGATAIRLDSVAGDMSGSTTATVSNSGSIRSASGAALVASDAASTVFGYVANQATGFIGGVSGTVQSLTNAGIIDGGAGSAYRFDDPSNIPNRRVGSANELDNTGTIRSTGNAATLSIPSASLRP